MTSSAHTTLRHIDIKACNVEEQNVIFNLNEEES